MGPRPDPASRATEPAPALAGEARLLERFRAGDRSVFRPLVTPHLGAMLSLARRLTGDEHWAEDLTQETLVRAFRALGELRDTRALRAWLLRILARLAGEPRRWRKRDRARSLASVEVPDRLHGDPAATAYERELRERLEEALERLTPRQRAALHLRAAEGLDYATIAGILGGSRAGARMLVLAARRRILDRMGRHLEP